MKDSWRAPISNRTFDYLGDEFAPYFDPRHFLGRSALGRPVTKPLAKIKKVDQIYQLELAVPGFSKDEIEVILSRGVLTVRGKKEKKKKEEEGEYILEEYDMDMFERHFRLSGKISHEKITANYLNGMLVIKFYDVPEKDESLFQKIEVY